MNIQLFKHDDWTKIYDGKWSFLTSTHFGYQYTRELLYGARPFKSQSIILVSHGRSAGWMRQKDRDILGAYLSGEIEKHSGLAKSISEELKTQAKNFLGFIDKHENTVATEELYREFWDRLLVYYHVHIYIKYVVDYLSSELLNRYLPDLQSARLAAEPGLNRSEDFMIAFTKLLSQKTTYAYTSLLCLTKEELYGYFSGDALPDEKELQRRDARAALLHDKKSFSLYVGSDVDVIEKIVHHGADTSLVKGQTGYGGMVTGRVRIVFDPAVVTDFSEGDILVAGSTRPEYLSLMKKAAAFVTDAGGILSHAAIVSREMKKPCVIGTKIATKVFKDGDMVEVDAERGIVRKL